MQRVGSRCQVMHGNAKMTGGGLKKKDLKYNKQGKIVSKKMSAMAKKEKRLQKAGYITKKGGFKLFKKQRGGGGSDSKHGNAPSATPSASVTSTASNEQKLYLQMVVYFDNRYNSVKLRSSPDCKRADGEVLDNGTLVYVSDKDENKKHFNRYSVMIKVYNYEDSSYMGWIRNTNLKPVVFHDRKGVKGVDYTVLRNTPHELSTLKNITNFSIITDEPVGIIEKSGKFNKVLTRTGKNGYVQTKYLHKTGKYINLRRLPTAAAVAAAAAPHPPAAAAAAAPAPLQPGQRIKIISSNVSWEMFELPFPARPRWTLTRTNNPSSEIWKIFEQAWETKFEFKDHRGNWAEYSDEVNKIVREAIAPPRELSVNFSHGSHGYTLNLQTMIQTNTTTRVKRHVRQKDKADIIALQEIPASRFPDLQKFADINNYEFVPHTSGVEGMAVLYNNQLPCTIEKKSEFSSGRPYMILNFDNFVFINLHAPHPPNITIQELLSPFKLYKSTRSILAGDFNRNMSGIPGYTNITSDGTCCSITYRGRTFTKPVDHILFSNVGWTAIGPTVATDYHYSDHKAIEASAELT